MGYRQYFYKLEKEKVNEIQDLTEESFTKWVKENKDVEYDLDELGIYPLYNLGEEFFGFGKYYENALEVQRLGEPLFRDLNLQKQYEEEEPFIVGKDALLNVIEFQRKLIVKYYTRILNPTEEDLESIYYIGKTSEDKMREHMESMLKEWESNFLPEGVFMAYDLDEDTEEITKSWKYEYSIFELVRLYKYTDWDKYCLLFMGW